MDARNAHVRTGEVIVTISGEPIHILRKYWEPNPWRVTVIGPRAGIIRVEISSQINSQELQLDLEGERKIALTESALPELLRAPFESHGRTKPGTAK